MAKTVGLLCLGLALLALPWLTSKWSIDEYSQSDFSATEWGRCVSPELKGSEGYHSFRANMLKDLISGKRLNGLTREQVVSLLGENESVGCGDSRDQSLCYILPNTVPIPLMVQLNFLHVQFDQSGIVSSAVVMKLKAQAALE